MSGPEHPDTFDPRPWRLGMSVGMPLFLVWTHAFIGLRTEHGAIALLFLALVWASRRSARFAVQALPFLAVGIAYDNLRLLLGLRGEIHVADLYALEKALFGVGSGEARQILPEFWRDHPVVFLDAVCGLAYITYLAESFLVGAYLFFREPPRFSRLAWAFLLVNLMGMATYILYPAAPPWYVEQYGLGPAVLDAAPSAAGAARFDALFGVSVFASFYSRNANVFGAMPSLHCAYPTLVFAVTWRLGRAWRILTGAFLALVAFSAVYLRHHYVLDVLAGVTYAAVAYFAVRAMLARGARASVASPGPAALKDVA